MIVITVLAFALLIFGASTLALALAMTRKARLEIEQRVRRVAGAPQGPAPGEKLDALVKAHSNTIDEYARRVFAAGIKRSWGMKTGALILAAIAFAAGAAGWMLTRHFFQFPLYVSAALSLGMAYWAPRSLLSVEQRRVESRFVDLFPDAVDTLARMLRAGLPITAAVRTIAIDGSPPVSTAFAAIGDQLKIGVPIAATLEATSRQIGLPDFRFFTVAVGLQYSTGGNLSSTLDILSEVIRKRRALRMKAKAATGEIRITAYTLGGIPIFTIGALMLLQPNYLAPLWTDPRGHLVIAMAGGSLLLAFISMRAMMRSVTNV